MFSISCAPRNNFGVSFFEFPFSFKDLPVSGIQGNSCWYQIVKEYKTDIVNSGNCLRTHVMLHRTTTHLT